jgi:hypothetical protein
MRLRFQSTVGKKSQKLKAAIRRSREAAKLKRIARLRFKKAKSEAAREQARVNAKRKREAAQAQAAAARKARLAKRAAAKRAIIAAKLQKLEDNGDGHARDVTALRNALLRAQAEESFRRSSWRYAKASVRQQANNLALARKHRAYQSRWKEFQFRVKLAATRKAAEAARYKASRAAIALRKLLAQRKEAKIAGDKSLLEFVDKQLKPLKAVAKLGAWRAARASAIEARRRNAILLRAARKAELIRLHFERAVRKVSYLKVKAGVAGIAVKQAVANAAAKKAVFTNAVNSLKSAGFKRCSGEGGVCQCNGQVKYGANQSWRFKNNVSGSVRCNNRVFGDPLIGTYKSCFCKTTSAQGLFRSEHQAWINANKAVDAANSALESIQEQLVAAKAHVSRHRRLQAAELAKAAARKQKAEAKRQAQAVAAAARLSKFQQKAADLKAKIAAEKDEDVRATLSKRLAYVKSTIKALKWRQRELARRAAARAARQAAQDKAIAERNAKIAATAASQEARDDAKKALILSRYAVKRAKRLARRAARSLKRSRKALRKLKQRKPAQDDKILVAEYNARVAKLTGIVAAKKARVERLQLALKAAIADYVATKKEYIAKSKSLKLAKKQQEKALFNRVRAARRAANKAKADAFKLKLAKLSAKSDAEELDLAQKYLAALQRARDARDAYAAAKNEARIQRKSALVVARKRFNSSRAAYERIRIRFQEVKAKIDALRKAGEKRAAKKQKAKARALRRKLYKRSAALQKAAVKRQQLLAKLAKQAQKALARRKAQVTATQNKLKALLAALRAATKKDASENEIQQLKTQLKHFKFILNARQKALARAKRAYKKRSSAAKKLARAAARIKRRTDRAKSAYRKSRRAARDAKRRRRAAARAERRFKAKQARAARLAAKRAEARALAKEKASKAKFAKLSPRAALRRRQNLELANTASQLKSARADLKALQTQLKAAKKAGKEAELKELQNLIAEAKAAYQLAKKNAKAAVDAVKARKLEELKRRKALKAKLREFAKQAAALKKSGDLKTYQNLLKKYRKSLKQLKKRLSRKFRQLRRASRRSQRRVAEAKRRLRDAKRRARQLKESGDLKAYKALKRKIAKLRALLKKRIAASKSIESKVIRVHVALKRADRKYTKVVRAQRKAAFKASKKAKSASHTYENILTDEEKALLAKVENHAGGVFAYKSMHYYDTK